MDPPPTDLSRAETGLLHLVPLRCVRVARRGAGVTPRHHPATAAGVAKLTRGMERTVLRLPATGVLGAASVVAVRVPD
ncbi:hypothetical protein C0L86_18240 [Streptomyces sp. SCA2-2]|nr:hypothetical protein C0L86_18240 [Streptomyces sp. SCA2-2]